MKAVSYIALALSVIALALGVYAVAGGFSGAGTALVGSRTLSATSTTTGGAATSSLSAHSFAERTAVTLTLTSDANEQMVISATPVVDVTKNTLVAVVIKQVSGAASTRLLADFKAQAGISSEQALAAFDQQVGIDKLKAAMKAQVIDPLVASGVQVPTYFGMFALDGTGGYQDYSMFNTLTGQCWTC